MTPDGELLRRYTETNSESAFAELVERHLNLVYSAALRQVNGDAHLAQDVAQTVFADLARKAASLARRPILTGWLYTSAHFAAAKAVRTERRRHTREEEAQLMNQLLCDPAPDLDWGKLRPVLDAAMLELNETDREAVLLRYFDNRPHAEIAGRLGLSENAARMRVDRALEKLRTLLVRRGVSTTAALSAVISANAVQVAPAGLAVTISTAALSGTTLANTATATATKAIAMTTLQKTLISAIVVASLLMPLLIHHKAQARLRDQDEALRQQTNQLAKLREKNQKLSNQFAQPKNSQLIRNGQFSELLKLRGEVGRLRNRAQELTKIAAIREEEALLSRDQLWPARVKRLKQWLEENPSEKIPELQSLSDRQWMDALYAATPETADEYRVAMSDVRSVAEHIFADFKLHPALQQYAKDNNGQFPTDPSQLRPYFDSPIYDIILERYTILPASSLVSELRPGGDWVFTQKAPVNEAHDWRTATSLTGTKQATPYATNRWVLIH